jgi:hypothetical protein
MIVSFLRKKVLPFLKPNLINVSIFLLFVLAGYFSFESSHYDNLLLFMVSSAISMPIIIPVGMISILFVCLPVGDVMGCDFTTTAVLYGIVSYVYGCFGYFIYSLITGRMPQKKEEVESKVKKSKEKESVEDAAFVFVLILIAASWVYFVYIPWSNAPKSWGISQCSFPPGFTCVSNKLQAGTAKLHLKIGQGTGHDIQINGINCTQQTDVTALTNGSYIYYPNYNIAGCANCTAINMSSGSSAVLADAMNMSGSDYPAVANNIICSTSSGVVASDARIGSVYNGKIYINYTELDTNLTKIIAGSYTATYEA